MQINKKIDNTFGSTLITTKNKIVLEVLSICFHACAEMQLVQNKKHLIAPLRAAEQQSTISAA